jgi:hypothetical protein
MRRNRVRSTSIASIGYLPKERELEIKFRASGDVYRYFDVPAEEYAAFMAAESKGTYLNQCSNLESTVMLWSRRARSPGLIEHIRALSTLRRFENFLSRGSLVEVC